ncbi:MAG: hypothetical protein ABJL67_23950 [Sulfitobacter sp.]
MTTGTFRVSSMTEAEIRERLSEFGEDITLENVSNTKQSGRRQPQGIEPFTYFVVVFAAHLAAGLAHDAIKKKLETKFQDKDISDSDGQD